MNGAHEINEPLKKTAGLVVSLATVRAGCLHHPRITMSGVSPATESARPLVRLHDVTFPLLVAAADWCVVEQEPTYGFLLMEIGLSKGQAGAEGGRGVSVVYVHPQSPAASAGLVPGDQLISVNERPVDGIRAEEVSQLIRRMTVAHADPNPRYATETNSLGKTPGESVKKYDTVFEVPQ